MAELAASIQEHGIIQPLTVRKLASGYYQIIAGRAPLAGPRALRGCGRCPSLSWRRMTERPQSWP